MLENNYINNNETKDFKKRFALPDIDTKFSINLSTFRLPVHDIKSRISSSHTKTSYTKEVAI